MLDVAFTIKLLGALFLAAGLVGVAGFCVALVSRTPGTSPLAQLFALVWSCTYLATGVLMWRRSRLAAPAFVAAMGLMTVFLSFIFPEARFLLPLSFGVTCLVAVAGCRYLRGACRPAA